MATLVDGATSWEGSFTLAKQIGTLLSLSTGSNYVDKDIELTLNVQSGAGAAGSASADANVESGGTGNISAVVGEKSTTAPSSGYYLKVGASASGNSQVTTAGWLNTGTLGTASDSKTLYFPVESATGSLTGTNTVTPSASVSGTNVTLSNTNNGILISATGGGTASASASAVCQTAGYVSQNATFGSGTINASSTSTVASSYISGVTLEAPSTGTRSFSVTVPKGDTTQSVTFTVDANGNVTVN